MAQHLPSIREKMVKIFTQIGNTSPDCKQVPQYHEVRVTILMHFRNPLRPKLQYHRHKITAWRNCWVSSGPNRHIENQMAPTITTWSTSIYLSWYFILSDKPVSFCQYWPWFLPGTWDLWDRPLPEISDLVRILLGDLNVRWAGSVWGYYCANYKLDYKSVKLFNIYSYLHKSPVWSRGARILLSADEKSREYFIVVAMQNHCMRDIFRLGYTRNWLGISSGH